jgi:hypothetical protein
MLFDTNLIIKDKTNNQRLSAENELSVLQIELIFADSYRQIVF